MKKLPIVVFCIAILVMARWYMYQVEACAFARGVEAVKSGLVSFDDIPILSTISFKLGVGDYRACEIAGKEL